ncbi:MAG: hypothetical protein NWE92_13370 [Candidatus Bathyarchaeota archaeon]|nr:hypothetical protein [Candidatus Bathyarchaeota archaeon]
MAFSAVIGYKFLSYTCGDGQLWNRKTATFSIKALIFTQIFRHEKAYYQTQLSNNRGIGLKVRLLVVLAVVMFVYCSIMAVSADVTTSIWRDEMDYQGLNQLEEGGWTVTHEDGVSFSGGAIVLDGTSQDTSIHYSNHFSQDISDWRVEDRSRWTLGSHCGNSVTAITNKHSYTFMADGWYGTFAFYRDGQKTTLGNYQESKNVWFTLAIEKQGSQINMYYNGEIKNTYTETDSSVSQLTAADAVSPWKGVSEYDYFVVSSTDGSTVPVQSYSFLSNPVVIGGIVGGALVGVGAAVYYFVIAGGSAASGSAGAAGGAAGGGAGSTAGTESTLQNGLQDPSQSGEANPNGPTLVAQQTGKPPEFGSSDLHNNSDLPSGSHPSGITNEFGKPTLNDEPQNSTVQPNKPNQTKPPEWTPDDQPVA